MGGQIVVDLLEGFGAVVVVGVDHGEGCVDHITGGQDGMAGAPGLGAAFRHGIALRQVVQVLIGIAHVHNFGQPVADGFLEGVLDLVLDDEHDGLKARAACVVSGIVDDDLAVVTHRVDLLQAAVPAAHTCCHHHKNRFFHNTFSLFFCL